MMLMEKDNVMQNANADFIIMLMLNDNDRYWKRNDNVDAKCSWFTVMANAS